MTREEQINIKLKEHFAHGWSGSVLDAFKEGAKWADNNPKEGLVSIAKVCEWLKNNVYEYTSVVNHDTEETNVELTTDFESFDEFIDAFSKAMKE